MTPPLNSLECDPNSSTMKPILLNPITLAGLIIVFLMGGWLLLLPTQLAGKMKQFVEQRTGRNFEIAGGSGLAFSPELGLNLYDITLAGSSSLAEPVLKSKVMFVPMSLNQLFGGLENNSAPTFINADLTLAFNAQGHSNVLIESSPDANKTDADAKAAEPIAFKVQSSTFHYSDERDGSQFILSKVSGEFKFEGDGGVSAIGSAEINQRHANFSVNLKSLERMFGEGSPVDFNLDSEGHAFSFSGRLATNTALNLAGQGSIESSDAKKLFKWLGLDISALSENQKFSVIGPFESQGSAFAVNHSILEFGNMHAIGDIAISRLAEKLNIVMQLDFESLNMRRTSKAESWSEVPFDASAFKNVDAQFQISAKSLHVDTTNLGSANIVGSIKNSVFVSRLKSDVVNVSQLKFDAGQVPPALEVALSTSGANAKDVLAALIGQNWLKGTVTMNVNLKAHGKSQAEMISNLSGTVDAEMNDVSLSGVDLKQLSTAREGWNGGQTDLSKAGAKLSIADGIATFAESTMEGVGLSILATGDIDILRQSLALSLEPISNLKILLNGAWGKPTISTIATTLH